MEILKTFMYLVSSMVVLRLILSFKSLLFFLSLFWRWLEEHTQAYQFFEIPRSTTNLAANVAGNLHENPLYRKALIYVSSLPSLEDCDGTQVFSSTRKPNDFYLQPGPGRPATDGFLGARLTWTHYADSSPAKFVLRLRRQDARRVLRPYLQHVESVADDLELRRRELRMFTHHEGHRWFSNPLTTPATLETIAMDNDLKSRLRLDLENFVKSKGYYNRLGKPWRRSYLLHGPPGTGKSSFAAAMAKFLCYDLYELNLSSNENLDLRSLLLQTTPRSVILVEDLDRFLHAGEETAEKRLNKILNVMDGVISSCLEERVLVFTVGSKDSVDPVALRPGRVDVQVSFSMCDFSSFKALASSYLGLKDHKLFPQVEEVFHGGAKISPAEVSEIMLANRGSPSRAVKTVITAVQQASGSGRRSKDWSPVVSGSLEEAGNGGGGGHLRIGFDTNATMREFKKLYGFIRRNGSKKEGVLPVEVAAAAAAAGGGHGDVVDNKDG